LHLFQFLLTSFNGSLPERENVFWYPVRPFFCIRANEEKVKNCLRNRGIYKTNKEKLDALFRVETRKSEKAGR
jgi:hypothetical protein